MKNYSTKSNFVVRNICFVTGIATSFLFSGSQFADAQVSSERGGKTAQRDQDRGNGRSEGRGFGNIKSDVGDGWQVAPQILAAIPAVVGDAFGCSAAMNEDGTILVVGASDANVDGVNAVGAVHIYTYSDRLNAWEHVQLLECPQKITLGQINGSPGLALFGWSVAISGTTIVVGAPVVTPNSGMPALAGRVYVFQQSVDDDLWGKIFQDERVANKILGPTDPEMIGYFGGSVAIDVDHAFGINDTRIAVGSTFRGTANQGGVYLFEGPGITPNLIVQKQFLLPEDVIAQDQFGSKVALDGDLLVVGAQLVDTDDLVNSGAAYVYRRSPNVGETIGTWSSSAEAILSSENGASEDVFGSSVSIVGNTIAVGAPGTDRGVANAGSFVVGTTYTIKFIGDTNFTSIGATSNTVGISFTATAPGEGTGSAYITSSSNGSAFVYRFTGGFWTLEDEVFPRESNAGNAFGYSLVLAMNGDQMVVGCPGYETTQPTGINVGCGFAYIRDRAGVWNLQATDLWSPSGRPSEGIGEACAFSQDGQKAVLGSRHNVSSGAFSTQIASNMFASTFGQTPKGDGIVVGTAPPTAEAPGADGYAPTVPTTGTGTGGIAPSTGGFGGSSAAIPATPTIEDWGVVRASVIAVNRNESRISILLTDANGQIETGGSSIRTLGFYDPTWQVLGVGDVNGDDSTDVLFSVPSTQDPTKLLVKAWIRVGYTVLETVTMGSASAGGRCIGISDWTGTGFDGPAFLHADGKSIAFWIIEGAAVTSKIEWAPEELEEGSWTFFTGEVTGDDIQDLIMFKGDGSTVLKVKVNSDQTVTTSSIPTPGPDYRIASAQDLDGDGSSDFLWENSSNQLRFYFLNSDGTVRFDTPWQSNLSGWRIDQAANFTTSSGSGIMFSKDGKVLVLTVRFEPLQTLPAGRGNIRVDYSRVLGKFDSGYTILGPANEPGN